MKRRTIAVMCILALLLSMIGCRKKGKEDDTDSSNTSMGRYVEQEVDQPETGTSEQMIAILRNMEGQLEYYTYEFGEESGAYKVYCYTLVDETYEKKEVEWASKAATSCGTEPVEICLGQNQIYYMLGQSIQVLNAGTEEEIYEMKSYLFQRDADEKNYLDITPKEWKEEGAENIGIKGNSIGNIQVSEKGVIGYHMNYEDDLYFYDLDQKKELNIGSFKTENDYIMKGSKLFYVPDGSSSVNSYDFDSEEEEKYLIDTIGTNINIQVSEEGDIYLLDTLGIHYYKNGGTMWETLVDGSICSMSVPSYMQGEFLVIPGEYDTFYVWYYSLIQNHDALLARYNYDKTVESTFRNELTIYSLWDNTCIREASSDYMKKHPDTKIRYVVANSDDTSATVGDQIRQLNTELLAGNGADIILLDGLPMESYIQKGVLLDMSDIFTELIENGSLVKNIATNYVEDGKVYGMPMRFYAPMYSLSENIEEETTSLDALAQLSMSSKKKLLGPVPYDTLLTMFLYTYSNELIGEDGLIDPTALGEFLSNIKTIADQTDALSEHEGDYGIAISSLMGYNQRIHNILCGNASELIISDIYASMGYVSDMMDLQLYQACANTVNGLYAPVNNTYIPNGIVGINKATKDTELAKDFIKSLYEEELQEKHLNDGFPMSSDALSKWMTEQNDDDYYLSFSIIDEDGISHSVEGSTLSLNERKEVLNILQSLTTPVNNDTILLDMIVEGGVSYLRGEKTLEEAVKDITDKINLYLSE